MSVKVHSSKNSDGTSPKKDGASQMIEGKVVSLSGTKLVMTNLQGRESTRTLSKDVKLSCDDTACKGDELKAGSRIRITTKPDDRNVVTCVEALSRNSDFKRCS